MSAPPLFRRVDERRVSVVRDAGAVRRVLDEDPVGTCMVASRVAEHGIDPAAIGGELWTRRDADESLCYAGANLIPLRGGADDLHAFADKAMSTARRCSSLVGRAEMVLPMWQRLEHAWGAARDVREHQPLMALSTAPAVCDRPGRAPGSRRRTRRVSGRGHRHVHRRGRHRPADRRRRPRLSAPGGRADRRGPRVGPLRTRPGGVQGRGGIAVAVRSARSRVCGCIPTGGAAASGPRAPRRWRRRSCAAVAPPACTSTASTPWPGRPTPASASPRWAPSRPFCSTDPPPQRRRAAVAHPREMPFSNLHGILET